MVSCLQKWPALPISPFIRSQQYFTLKRNQIWSRGLWHGNEVQEEEMDFVCGQFQPGLCPLCVHMLCEMTDVSGHNLCPRMLWTPVFPRKILPDSPVQCRPDLLDPKGSLSRAFPCVCLPKSSSLSLSDTHSSRQPSSCRATERKGEKWLLSFFLF